jgi:hypothetical protein
MMKLLAQGSLTNPVIPYSKGTDIGLSFIKNSIPKFIGLGIVIGSLIFFFVMLIGAIQWIASGGDKAAIEAARGKIVNAIVGVVILFCLFVILKLIGDFFGFNILELNIKPLIIGSGT